jgi:L-ascorbate metabolism protein UlaG (beta-lactamase superfamily)
MSIDSLYSPSKPIPISNHFNGKKFFNPHSNEKFHFFRLLKWLIKRKEAKWPKWVKNNLTSNLPISLNAPHIAITFINHASFLIQTPNLNILIDPIYSKRAGPLPFIGPKRVRLPGVPFSDLPNIDIVLISHNHYDHLDIPTLKRIKKFHHNSLFITGLKNKALLKSHGINNVVELDWWKTHTHDCADFIFTPAQHFSSRTLFDRNNSLWGGFIINIHNKKIYFAGDSGYSPHFKAIHNEVGHLDLALLPIGAYQPRWFMKPVHMNPQEAVQAHLDLNAKLSIPMHYGTFPLADDPFDQPLIDLRQAMQKYKVSNIKVLDFGQTHFIH